MVFQRILLTTVFVLLQIIFTRCLLKQFDFGLDPRQQLLASIPTSFLVMIPASLLVITNRLWFLIAYTSLQVMFIFWVISRTREKELVTTDKLTFVLIGFSLLQLALGLFFIKDQSYPLFFDSITHHEYISTLKALSFENPGELLSFPTRLYHYGYHVVMAAVASLSNIQITKLMLYSGVVFLAVFPISLISLLGTLKPLKMHVIVSTFLVILACNFPFHALNWGKYPALMSCVALPSVLGLLSKFFQAKVKRKTVGQAVFLAILLLNLGFTHIRSIFVILSFVIASLIYRFYQKNHANFYLFIGVIALAWLILFLRLQEAAANPGLEIMLVVFSVFATYLILKRSRTGELHPSIFAVLLFVLLTVFAKIPIPMGLEFGSNLMNAEYYSMVLTIPLSLFVAGIAGEVFPSLITRYPTRAYGIFTIAVLMVMILTPWKSKLEPIEKFVLVSEDQEMAIDWIREQSQESRLKILVAGSPELDYLEYADSGGWLSEMTGEEIVKIPPDISFGVEGQMEKLCENQFSMIYIDRRNEERGFGSQPIDYQFYKRLFLSGDVEIIQPICE